MGTNERKLNCLKESSHGHAQALDLITRLHSKTKLRIPEGHSYQRVAAESDAEEDGDPSVVVVS